jgi:acyl carrier protein
VHPDASGEHRLVAYVVPHDGIKITATELRRALKMALPEYMVPSLFIELDALPLTDNRKVNRRALPPPFAAVPASERFIEPATPTARQIAAIWCEVLGIDRVSADANFFDVGGHSLLAMKVIARIESSLGVRFGARALMLETLEQMAASCERQLGAATGAAMPARVRRAAYAGA